MALYTLISTLKCRDGTFDTYIIEEDDQLGENEEE